MCIKFYYHQRKCKITYASKNNEIIFYYKKNARIVTKQYVIYNFIRTQICQISDLPNSCVKILDLNQKKILFDARVLDTVRLNRVNIV